MPIYADVEWKKEEDLSGADKEKMEVAEHRCSTCSGDKDLRWCAECGKYFCDNCNTTKNFDGFTTGWAIFCPNGHKLYVRAWKCD